MPHPAIDVVLETRSMLLHDLVHYAVEGAEGLTDGFWGLLAGGASLADLRDPDAITPEVWERLLRIERRVARLQGALARGGPEEEAARTLLRAVRGAWAATSQGRSLELSWPPSSPRVVQAPA